MTKRRKWLLAGFLLQGICSAAFAYNYGEALQKAIYFYECQVTGPKPAWNRVQWRGDSCLNDAVTGGWADAGDHVKFGLPMAYSASMLGWAIYEYGNAINQAGQLDELQNNLRFVLDYFVRCHQGNQLVYQIGDPGPDHAWWGPIEVVEKRMTRPSYTTNASCVTGQTAAALAIGSIVLQNSTYLTHAKALFTLADTTKSDEGYTAASGFYSSWSGFYDELMWAGVWLYLATRDNAYLAKIEPYLDNLNRQGQDDPRIEFQWGQCWDDCHYGAILLLARLTGKQVYHDFLEIYFNWWTTGEGTEKVAYTPGGLAWLDSWGALRYATSTAFLAFLYADLVGDSTLETRCINFAEKQINYCLGANPGNRSYVVGYGSNAPRHPHHRTSHGSWCDQQTTPASHRHTLYGALVGGPDQSDSYQDVISDYTMNEVATDYNAGFVCCLARMYDVYGGNPLGSFPPAETPEDEFFVEASINSSGQEYTEIRAYMNNRSGWPARLIKDLSFNYYMDLSEIFAAGLAVSDIKVSRNGSGVSTAEAALTRYSGNIYYTKVRFTDGTVIAPISQSDYAREVQLRISAPNSCQCWDPANDPSCKGITSSRQTAANITVYDGTRLIFGTEPDGTKPVTTPWSPPASNTTVIPPPTPYIPGITPGPTAAASTPVPTGTVKRGDVNGDGSVAIVDALMTAQYSVGLRPAGFNTAAADFNGDGTITIVDALMIAQCYVGLISCT